MFPPHGTEILECPFFTLEYQNGSFIRHIPPDAEDLGSGSFSWKEKTYRLSDADEALANKEIAGRTLLSLLKRGHHPLIKNGPHLADNDDHLMELRAIPPYTEGAEVIHFELHFPRGAPDNTTWLTLTDLPRHIFFQNVIYEIIERKTIAEIAEASSNKRDNWHITDGENQNMHFTLKGEAIPAFAGIHARLIFQFADQKLKSLLAEDSIFIARKDLEVILGAAKDKTGMEGGMGRAYATPYLAWKGKRYPLEEVSARMDREYILLDNRWARRDDLLSLGIAPFHFFAGGTAIERIRLKPGELLHSGGARLAAWCFPGLFSRLEQLPPPPDAGKWTESSSPQEIFHAHLNYLHYWGLSGGVTLGDRGMQASCLSEYLVRLAAGGWNVLCLLEKSYYELYLSKNANEFIANGIDLPEKQTGKAQVRLALYDNIPHKAALKRIDILVLVEPEAVLGDEPHAALMLKLLQNIDAEIVLGIFSNTWNVFQGKTAAKIRNLFGIDDPEDVTYFVRSAKSQLRLPEFKFTPGSPQRNNVFTFNVEEKFTGLDGPSLYSELSLFEAVGTEVPFIPLRLLKGSLNIDRMDADEKTFYIYWRAAFRQRKILKTDDRYIRVYARELCLFIGKEGALGNFRQLLSLWECYHDIYSDIEEYLPAWIFDFLAVYAIGDDALNLLLPNAAKCVDPALGDINIYRRFIAENNIISFNDVRYMISGAEKENEKVHRDFETVINAIDRHLREVFHIRLFEFFFPPVLYEEKREAFAGMERAGKTVYTICGTRFSKHRPLSVFLANLFAYTAYCYKIKNRIELKGGSPGKCPPLDEVWKLIADRALGFADNAPATSTRPKPQRSSMSKRSPTPTRPGGQISLSDAHINQLRNDSNAVRDLLKIENKNESQTDATKKPHTGFRKSPTTKKNIVPIKKIIASLNPAEREALKVIATQGSEVHHLLEKIGRKYHLMPELMIDRINTAFLEGMGDLLIEVVDGVPMVGDEYLGEVKSGYLNIDSQFTIFVIP